MEAVAYHLETGLLPPEARKALNRLRRALEKTRHEMDAVAGALQSVEGDDFPHAEFDAAMRRLEGCKPSGQMSASSYATVWLAISSSARTSAE